MLDRLLSMEEVTRIVINTDARDQLGPSLPSDSRVAIRDRRPDLCGDSVSMNLILADDLGAVPADVYLMTHVTNPLLSARTIRRALETFWRSRDSGSADSLFSVTRHQARFYDRDGRAINHDPSVLIRTQELEPMLEENSSLYLFTRASFAATRARIGPRPILFETPALESLDIDEESDWQLVEALIVAQGAAAQIS